MVLIIGHSISQILHYTDNFLSGLVNLINTTPIIILNIRTHKNASIMEKNRPKPIGLKSSYPMVKIVIKLKYINWREKAKRLSENQDR